MFILFIFILFFAAIFQITSGSYISILGVEPNLVLVFLLFLFISKDYKQILTLTFLGGLLIDLFSPFPLGAMIISLLFTMKIVDFTSRNILSKPNLIIVAIIGAGSTFVYRLILFTETKIMFFLNLFTIKVSHDLFYSLPIEMLYNTGILIGIYLMLKKYTKHNMQHIT